MSNRPNFDDSNWILDAINLEMVHCPAGSFKKALSHYEYNRGFYEIQCEIILPKPFKIGKFPITQKQYEAVMDYNPSFYKIDENNPVEWVSCKDAELFCEKLNSIFADLIPKGYRFDLPTDAQWEYACRAGLNTPFNEDVKFKDVINEKDIEKNGWFLANSKLFTHPVGQKEPNAWGIYDMQGNVCELCRDNIQFWDIKESKVIDPIKPFDRCSTRGGSFYSNIECYCFAEKSPFEWLDKSNYIGFRVALVPDEPEENKKNTDLSSLKTLEELKQQYFINKVSDYKTDLMQKHLAIWKAIKNKAPYEEIKQLIESSNALKESKHNGFNLLVYAVLEYDNPELIKLMVSKGVSYRQTGPNRYKLTDYACVNPNPQVMQTLLDFGSVGPSFIDNVYIFASADVYNILRKKEKERQISIELINQEIMELIKYSNINVIKSLVNSGELTVKNFYYSMLEYAIDNNASDEMIELLAEYVKYKLQKNIFEAARNPNLKLLKIMEDKGCNFTIGNNKEEIFVNALTYNTNPDIIDYLIDKNLFIDDLDLIYSSIVKNPSVAVWKRLLEIGLKKELNTQERYYLLRKIFNQEKRPNIDIVKLLADENSVKMKDDSGYTVLMGAAFDVRDPEIFKLLIETGADVNAKNKNGATAANIAEGWNSNKDITKLLKEYESGNKKI